MLTEWFALFPRCIGRGKLDRQQLKTAKHQCEKLFSAQDQKDWSERLAGRLDTQILMPETLPLTKELSAVFAEGCLHWIESARAGWDGVSKDYWKPGTYGVQIYEVWLNKQLPGDYNPVHIHGGDFSGVLYIQVPPQIDGIDISGALGIHGPECFDPARFQMGMMQYFQPVEGDYYIFPAWQPHSVMPFKGEGERWSIAFNAEMIRT